MLQLIKATDSRYVLEVLALPYKGQNPGNRDNHQEYFSPSTSFMEEVIPLPPVFYYHGAALGQEPTVLGKTLSRWVDDSGVWYKVQLDPDHERANEIADAAINGKAYASTGVVPASRRVNKTDGHIEQWLVGELSLWQWDGKSLKNSPSNHYAIVRPSIKALEAELQIGDRTLSFEPGKRGKMGMIIELRRHIMSLLDRVDEMEGEDETDAEPAAAAISESVKCSACGGCPGCTMDDEDTIKGVDPMDEDVKILKAQVAALKGQVYEAEEGAYVTTLVTAGKLSPALANRAVELLVAARGGDIDVTIKSGPTLYAGIRQLLVDLPVTNPIIDNTVTLGYNLNPLNSGKNDQVDPDYLAKMRTHI